MNKQILLFSLMFLFSLSFVSAGWSSINLTDGANNYTIENLTFTTNQNITRYLSVPQSTILTNAYINLSGFISNYTILNDFYQNSTEEYYNEIILGSFSGSHGFSKTVDSNFDTYGAIADGVPSILLIYQNFSFAGISPISVNLTHESAYFNYAVPDVHWSWSTIYYLNYTSNLWNLLGYSNCLQTIPGVSTTGSNTCKFIIPEDGINRNNKKIQIKTNMTSVGSPYNGMWYSESKITTVGNYLSNPSLSINNASVWNYTGQFNQTNNKTNNFASTINTFLSTCTYSNGFCLVPFIFHSDTAGILQYLDLLFNNQGILENSQTYNSTSFETKSETFSINLTYDSNIYSSSSANLNYAGTNYAGTKTTSGTNIIFTKALDIPLGNGTKSFFWNISLTNSSGTTYYQSNNYTQIVNSTYFGLCNATLVTPTLNLTFQDETSFAWINANIPTSTFEYYLGSGSVSKTYLFTNTSENSNYQFCISHNSTFHIDPYVQYSGTGYPQKIWNPTVNSYNNSITNQLLYLLGTDDGIPVTFQVVNSADQVLSGVLVSVVKTISGESVVVGTGVTGDDGAVTFWLSPDYVHTITFSKTGFTDYVITITPTQSSYTITMVGGGSSVSNDYTRGISISILPSDGELFNDTAYDFSMALTSSFWDLDSFGFNLRLANGTIVGSDSLTDSGTALFNYNVNNQSIIYMDYYWIVNGTTLTGSKYWVVTNSELTGWSIKNFFVDLKLYLDSGIFGLDNFGRLLITFIIMFIVVGIMSHKYGLTSPISVATMIFAVVFFFDITIGLIPQIRGIDHLLTYIAGIMLVGLIIREVSQ